MFYQILKSVVARMTPNERAMLKDILAEFKPFVREPMTFIPSDREATHG